MKLPAECINCGDPSGPEIEVGDDFAGWLCPRCYREAQCKRHVWRGHSATEIIGGTTYSETWQTCSKCGTVRR